MGLLSGRKARVCSLLVSFIAAAAVVVIWITGNNGIFCDAGLNYDAATAACSNKESLVIKKQSEPYWQHSELKNP